MLTRQILIDSGILILLSYDQQNEALQQVVVSFFDQTTAQAITAPICIAGVLWLLGDPGDARVLAAQNHLLRAVSTGGIEVVDWLPEDDNRIAELNSRYADLPGDVADLTLVALSEQLEMAEILSLDGDVDLYRRIRREPSAAFLWAEGKVEAAIQASVDSRTAPPTNACGLLPAKAALMRLRAQGKGQRADRHLQSPSLRSRGIGRFRSAARLESPVIHSADH